MLRPPLRAWLVACTLPLATACSDQPTAPGSAVPEVSLAIVSGDGQVGPAGRELPLPLVVSSSLGGSAHPGILVNFRVVQGGGSVWAGSAITDPDGIAQDYWTLGPDVGEQVVEVRTVHPSTGGKFVWGTFTANATPDYSGTWTHERLRVICLNGPFSSLFGFDVRQLSLSQDGWAIEITIADPDLPAMTGSVSPGGAFTAASSAGSGSLRRSFSLTGQFTSPSTFSATFRLTPPTDGGVFCGSQRSWTLNGTLVP